MENLRKDNISDILDEKLTISFYGGEPLLNFTFIKSIVSYMTTQSKLKEIVRFSMTTNGLLLDKYIDFLAKYNFNISISLDGNKYNNQYRVFSNGRESFEKVVRNVEYVQSKFPSFFRDNVNFLSVLHNKNSFQQIFKFTYDKFGKYSIPFEINPIYLNPLHREEFYKTFIFTSYNNDYNLLLESNTFIRNPKVRSFLNFLERYTTYFYVDYYDLLFIEKENYNGHLPSGTCLPFSLRLYITVKGDIFPCEHINDKFKIGKFKKNLIDLNEFKIAEFYNNYFKKLRRICINCYNFKTCGECMFNNETINSDFITCKYFMNYKKFSEFLSTKISYIEENPTHYKRIIKEAYNG